MENKVTLLASGLSEEYGSYAQPAKRSCGKQSHFDKSVTFKGDFNQIPCSFLLIVEDDYSGIRQIFFWNSFP